MTEKTASPHPPADPGDAETPSEFARALEEHERGAPSAAERAAQTPAVGAKIRGRVVAVGDEHTLIDFGGRSEAVAETRHFRSEDGTLTAAVGDTLELFVVEAGDPVVLGPSVRPEGDDALPRLREARAAGVPVTGRVMGLNAGGLEVDLGRVRGFCPVSQVEAGYCADPSVHVGRTLDFLVTSVEAERGTVVLSRKRLLRRLRAEEGRRLLTSLGPGEEREGTVSRLEPFGAFVDLGGADGLVHVSEIRHERVGHPREVLRPGEKVRVRVLRIERGKKGGPRIALSIKACMPDPWAGIAERFVEGSRVQGVVARLTDFGAFVTLAPGIDALIHVSEAAAQRVTHVKEVLAPGQTVEAVVLGVDPAKRRISLSIRQLLAGSPPAARVPEVGEVVEGRVATVKPFGVFVDLPDFGPRASGLLPREACGVPRDADLSSRYAVGQPLQVQVVQHKGGRIRVGLVGGRAPRRGRGARPPAAPPREEPPMTTMAIALRKAIKEAGSRHKEKAPR